MSEPTIICPKCHAEIKLTESLAAPLIASTQRQYEQRLTEQLQQQRVQIAADEAAKAQLAAATDLAQRAKQITELQEVLKQRDEKLAIAQTAQADLIRKQRELDDAKREMDLTIERRIQESLAATRQQAKKEAEEQSARKIAESQQTIATLQKEVADIAQREQAVKDAQATLARAKDDLERQLQQRLDAERTKIVADEAAKAKQAHAVDLQQRAKELAELQEVLRQRDEKLAIAQNAQAELIRKQRELDDARREMELTIEKRIQESLGVTREQAKKEAEEAISLRVMEKDQLIQSMQKQVEELKRKADQGSQQLQGEVLELQLEALLSAKFLHDRIEPVPKGEHGGDILQRVLLPAGAACGTILWETKRTKNWTDSWLAKLRDDQRAAKAEIAVIVSAVLPKGVETFDQVDGIWVIHPKVILPVAMSLRQMLIEVNHARQASDGQQTKMEMVYQYLTGPKFRLRVQAIVESVTDMNDDLQKEKKAIMKQWAKREEQLGRVIEATTGMYGELQGIAGRSLKEIEGLDLEPLGLPDANQP